MKMFNINNGDDLVLLLTSMQNAEGVNDYYDHVLMMRLFKALLDNMITNSHEGDWEVLSEMLTSNQKEFLKKITDFVSTHDLEK